MQHKFWRAIVVKLFFFQMGEVNFLSRCQGAPTAGRDPSVRMHVTRIHHDGTTSVALWPKAVCGMVTMVTVG
jgi:hypothetical protein